LTTLLYDFSYRDKYFLQNIENSLFRDRHKSSLIFERHNRELLGLLTRLLITCEKGLSDFW